MSASQNDASRISRRKKVKSGVAALVVVLETVKSSSDSFNFPIGPVIDGMLKLCEVFLIVCKNEDAISELMGNVKQLHETLFPLTGQERQLVLLSDGLKRRISGLEETLRDVSEDVTTICSRSLLMRLINASDAADKIQICIQRLSWALKTFLAGCTMDIYLGVEGLHEIAREGFRNMGEQMDDIGNRVEQLAATTNTGILPGLPYVPEARFDYFKLGHSICDSNTRKEVLSEISNWLQPTDDSVQQLQEAPPDAAYSKPVFWINGVAGTGKSTLAKTIAHRCHDTKTLAATFFCSRSGGRSNVQYIFPTIAYQLALLFEPLMDVLKEIVPLNPHIHTVYAWQQLQKLIIDPLRETRERIAFKQYVIVIDALDECDDKSAVSVILEALSMHVLDLHPLKFLVTSRPDEHITAGFSLNNISQNTQILYLDSFPELTSRDITHYLSNQFRGIREGFQLPDAWPSHSDIEAVTELSGQLFIFAATAVKFVADDTTCDPKSQLSTLLQSSSVPHNPSAQALPGSPYVRLDALYRQVLQSAFPGAKPSQLTKVRLLLGTIVLAQERLSLQAYCGLLNDDLGPIHVLVRKLHSIIVRPTAGDDPFRFVHLSFADFIVDPSRCTLHEYLILPEVQHSVLATSCLKVMLANLKFNLCAVEDESLLNSEIPDLGERISRCIPPHVLYSCRYWSYHLCRCHGIDEDLFNLLLAFSKDYLLHWLSALSLVGAINVAIEALTSVLDTIQNVSSEDSSAATLLRECAQMVRAFLPAIIASWSEVYRGTLSFLSQTSALRRQYLPQHTLVKTKIEVLRGLQKPWDFDTLTMATRAESVEAVCFSLNGRWIISADYRGDVIIWDSQSGVQVRVLEESNTQWMHIIMSPDNCRILAAGWTEPIQIDHPNRIVFKEWDTATGSCITSWTTRSPMFPNLIVYSPDGKYRVVVWGDDTIAIWDAGSSATSPLAFLPQAPDTQVSAIVSSQLEGPGNRVTSSHDGTLLFLISWYSGILRVWDMQSRTLQGTYSSNHRWISVGLSHSDELIACGCRHSTTVLVEILDRRTMRCIHTLKDHGLSLHAQYRSGCTAVYFSPDDALLVALYNSPLEGTDILVYDVDSGALLTHILSPHSYTVKDLHFESAHKLRYVMGALDQYIRVRDVSLYRPKLHRGRRLMSSVRQVWSHLQDTIIPRAGPHIQHSDGLDMFATHTFEFSPDGSILATTRIGNVLRLWDVATGEEIQVVSDRTTSRSRQKSITWSPSGQWLAMSFRQPEGLGSKAGMMFLKVGTWTWQGPFYGSSEDDYLSASFLAEGERSNDKELIVLSTHPNTKWMYYRHVTVQLKEKTLVTRQVVKLDDIHPWLWYYNHELRPTFMLSSDSSRVVICGKSSPGRWHLVVLQVPSGQVLHRFHREVADTHDYDDITSLALSSDSTTAVCGTYGGMVLVWNLVCEQQDEPRTYTADNSVDRIWYSPMGPGESIVTDLGLTPLQMATSGAGHLSAVYFISEGWLWRVARDGCQRVGWVPPDFRHRKQRSDRYRGMMAVGHGDVIAFLKEDGDVVIVRLKQSCT